MQGVTLARMSQGGLHCCLAVLELLWSLRKGRGLHAKQAILMVVSDIAASDLLCQGGGEGRAAEQAGAVSAQQQYYLIVPPDDEI